MKGSEASRAVRFLLVALMDARSIAATAANKRGYLTPATAFDVEYKG